MLRRFVRRQLEPVRRLVRQISERETGRYPLCHQGIQRSGTNFLATVLRAADYRVLNRIDPRRDNPCHKHFRWQDDKGSIVMDVAYRNDVWAASAAEVNAICGHPEGTRHVVLFRDPRSWLDSICRWGLDTGWFPSREAFLEQGLHEAYLHEWHAYYAAWEKYHTANPELVTFVYYGALKRAPDQIVRKIDNFVGVRREAPLTLPKTFGPIRHSRPMSEHRIGMEYPDLDRAASALGAFDWRTHVTEHVGKIRDGHTESEPSS